MQLFSADDTVFKKKRPEKMLIFDPPFFFSVLPTDPNQPKSNILFYKNGSLHNFDCYLFDIVILKGILL